MIEAEPSRPYRPRWPFTVANVNTIWASLVRRPPRPEWRRERVDTPDRDFLDLDWLDGDGSRLVVLFHGLEGSSESGYIRGMANAFSARGWGVLAMNYRGCSGEPNRSVRSYHCGATDDVALVVDEACARADRVLLIGFSLGGNLVLRYAGEAPGRVPPNVIGVMAVSAPVDPVSASARLSEPRNRAYSTRFLRKLKRKVQARARSHPGSIDLATLATVRTLYEFDELYTAPIHGFHGALDYYRRTAAKDVLGHINRPALIVNAADDPLLGASCFEIETTARLRLEVPSFGGHVGFVRVGQTYWSEARALRFAEELGCR